MMRGLLQGSSDFLVIFFLSRGAWSLKKYKKFKHYELLKFFEM